MKSDEVLYQRVGKLTRQLHDALRELGYDRNLETAVSSLPEARTRLSYISRLTGEAAEKVLNNVDRTKVELDRLRSGAAVAAASLAQAPQTVAVVADFLGEVDASAQRVDDHLTEIMLAQDFHDLTGQVIRKVLDLAQSLEAQLVEMLVTAHPEPETIAVAAAELQGPVVVAEGRTDVVANQAQVDDLLESLGF